MDFSTMFLGRKWIIATVVLLLGLVLTSLLFDPYLNPPSEKRRAHLSLHGGSKRKQTTSKSLENDKIESDDNNENPFPPPLYGYDSMKEMKGRDDRFPSVQERVQIYMSNWYLPPCPASKGEENDDDEDGLIHYRFVDQTGKDIETNDGIKNDIKIHVIVRETVSIADADYYSRVFELDSNTTLGRIHFMAKQNMYPKVCDSEYCDDILHHWYPSVERVVAPETNIPWMFQFSDEEFSQAYSPESNDLQPYPNLPHLKKSRLSLMPQDIQSVDVCAPFPKKILPTVSQTEHLPDHMQPIIYKLKTNRHYGMMGNIPPKDSPWNQKKNQAIFRGTLTGLLPPDSRFSLSTRNSHAPTLANDDAKEKCKELERCRLVYEVNRFYDQAQNSSKLQTPLVDAKLVLPMLQHTDMPKTINDVQLFGNRMTKQGLMKYKAIIMLEGNDAGTGFKWALFSNSVVMTALQPKFTSWAMEEMLEPWLHYIPLDPDNFAQDVHDKMQWVIEHDEEAQQIARRGSLWIRDLLIHPDAMSDDEAVTDEMVRRYMAHFIYDQSLEYFVPDMNGNENLVSDAE